MTAPLVSADVDLLAFPYYPLFRRRLFRSTFHAKSSDAAWRAGVTLWIMSCDQQPAGSLPDDDRELRRLAGFTRRARDWARIKPMALRGWILCDDGRLYHPVVAEVVAAMTATRRPSSSEPKTTTRRPTDDPTRASTKREPPLKSMPKFRELNLRESPPLNPPPTPRVGDDLLWNGIRPIGEGPKPIHPKRLGHALPCACNNCSRWAALHPPPPETGDRKHVRC